jgi:hypothetical protein
MKRAWVFVAVAVLGAGCSTVPFRSLPRGPMAAEAPSGVLARFEGALPGSFRIVNSVVFQFHGFRFSSLGYVAVDSAARSFAIAGMNPAGVKLFEITGTNDQVTSRFMIEGFPHEAALAAAIGQAIREMYFDLVPPADADARPGRDALVFRTAGVEYIFGGADGNLVEKRFRRGWRCRRRIGFYDYRRQDGKLYPGEVVLFDRRYGYSLIVRLKEIRD